MNKIFKVVWSKVRNAYVVVSEIAKNTVSGVGKRNRVNRFSLGATLAALALTSSFFVSNEAWAGEIKTAVYTQYIAIEKSGMGVWGKRENGYLTNNQSLTLSSDGLVYEYDSDTNDPDNVIIKYVKQTIGSAEFFVREGYTISGENGKITSIVGNPKQGTTLATLQHKRVWMREADDTTLASTVTGKALNDVDLATYGAATNAGGVEAKKSWVFKLDWHGNGNYDDYVGKSGYDTTTTIESVEQRNGNYYYNNEIVSVNDVYFLTNDDNTSSPYVFVNNGVVYSRTVMGEYGEVLLTGVDSNGNSFTYWGAKSDDRNTLLRDSGMTVHQLHESFEHLQDNDLVLSHADAKGLVVTKNTIEGTGGTLKLKTKDGTILEDALTISRSAVDGSDTKLTFSDAYGSAAMELVTGSRVSVTVDDDDKSITQISVNGTPHIVKDTYIDYSTAYTVSDDGKISLKLKSNSDVLDDKIVTINGIATKGDISTLNTSIGVINNNIGTINTSINTMMGNITSINSNINTIEGNITDIKDFIENNVGVQLSTSNVDGNKINLLNRSSGTISSIKVVGAGGEATTDNNNVTTHPDTSITFGEGASAFTINTGSVVAVEKHDTGDFLDALILNGKRYELFDTEQLAVANNLQVTGGDATSLERHGWVITDNNQTIGEDKIQFKDTTLVHDDNVVADGNNNYTITDTGGNQVVLKGVGSATQVETNRQAIENIIKGSNLKFGVIDKTAKTIGLKDAAGNAISDNFITVGASSSQGSDVQITFGGDNGFSVSAGSKVSGIIDANGIDAGASVLKGLEINGTDYAIYDTKLQNVVTVTDTDDNGATYKVSDTSGAYAELSGIAKYVDGIKNVQIDGNTVKLVRNNGDIVNGELNISSSAWEPDSNDNSYVLQNGSGDAKLTITAGDKSISLTTGSIVNASVNKLENGEYTRILNGIYINGTLYNLPSHQTEQNAFDDFALHDKDNGYSVDDNGTVTLTVMDKGTNHKPSYNVTINGIALKSHLGEIEEIDPDSDGRANNAESVVNHINKIYTEISSIKTNNADYRLVGATVSGPDTNDKYTYTMDPNNPYKVSSSNTITLYVQDQNTMKQADNIIISDVARSSDLGNITDINTAGNSSIIITANSPVVTHINNIYNEITGIKTNNADYRLVGATGVRNNDNTFTYSDAYNVDATDNTIKLNVQDQNTMGEAEQIIISGVAREADLTTLENLVGKGTQFDTTGSAFMENPTSVINHINNLYRKVGEVDVAASKHSTVSVSTISEPVANDRTKNLVLKVTPDYNNAGYTNYEIALNDDLVLGTSDMRKIFIKGSEGKVQVGAIEITNHFDQDGTTRTGAYITGLTNLTWNHESVVDSLGRAATEAQLKQAIDSVNVSVSNASVKSGEVKPYTYDAITGGSSSIVLYNHQNQQIAKIDGLKDTTLKKNEDNIGVAVSGNNYEKHYTISDTNGNNVVLKDVASASEVNNKFIEVDEHINSINGSITNINSELDEHSTKISTIETNIQNINSQISAGKIDHGTAKQDGTIDLYNAQEEIDANKVATISGLENHSLIAHSNESEAIRVQENGIVELLTIDRYDYDPNSSNNVTYSTYIADVASKKKLDDLTGAVGVESKEKVVEKYQDTTFLKGTDTEPGPQTLVDADVELDKAITSVAAYSIQNIEMLQRNDQYLDSRINQLGSKVNKVGAGAAALAALHPMDFDPDDKLSFAVGAGNYAGENATALGAFYRPNEKVMMSVGGTYGNGENMVNMGVSFALDRTNNVSNSRTAMAKEIVDLREQVATQGQQIAQLVALVQQLAGATQPIVPAEQLFPDVPQNHWAYEYVNGLVAKGIIEGYPDGTFGGDRTMTRYEFAAMLFRAMEQGVVLSEQIRQEFEPELGRIRVDRVKGTDADLNKIERVRVNTAVDRDDYGSKVVQVKH